MPGTAAAVSVRPAAGAHRTVVRVPPTLADLRTEVSSRFAGLALPAWPRPRPEGAEPRPEEYSRLTDPGRYRVVHARARVWADVLAERVGARLEQLTPPEPDAAGRRAFDRGLRVTSPLPGRLPLVLLERDVRSSPDDAALAVLDTGVSRADVVLDSQPDCGCDACDDGSVDLLGAVDDTIASVVGGPHVVLRGPWGSASWYPDGGRGSFVDHAAPDRVDFRDLMDRCRRLAAGEDVPLPDGTEALVGASWLDRGASRHPEVRR